MTDAEVPAARALRLADHPRARRHIALAKGWGGLATFALALLLSLRAGVPAEEAILRAVGLGVAGTLVAWALAVVVWRQVAVAEIEAARRRIVARLEELEAERSGETT